MFDVDNAVQVAIEAARKAGQIAKNSFRKPRQVRYKGKANIVTDVDLLAEEAIVNLITSHYPQHNILSEEAHALNRGSELTWVIDPLDGTFNYAAGVPFFAVSIALVQGEKAMLGVVLEPLGDELFVAEAGRGARLGSNPIRVSSKTSLQDAVIGLDLGYDEEGRRRAVETMAAARPNIQAFRVMGSAVLGLCYAACARFDIYFHANIYPWDIAAAGLIVEEAGGIVTDGSGNPYTIRSRSILGASSVLHEQFLSVAPPYSSYS